MQDRKLVVATSLLTVMLLAGGFVNILYASITTELDEFPNSQATVVVQVGLNVLPPIMLTGPTTVLVDFINLLDGIPANNDPDGNGMEQVPTEIVSMTLTGGGIMLTVPQSAHPERRTLGQIEESANLVPDNLDVPCDDPVMFPCGAPVGNTANSFFDVFFEVTLPDGTKVHNDDPLRVSSVIRNKPPAVDDQYCELGPVPLFTVNPAGNHIQIGQLVEACHTPNPPSPVGGEILPINTTSLFVAGAFTNAFWILPLLGAIGGAVAGAVIAIRVRRRKIN